MSKIHINNGSISIGNGCSIGISIRFGEAFDMSVTDSTFKLKFSPSTLKTLTLAGIQLYIKGLKLKTDVKEQATSNDNYKVYYNSFKHSFEDITLLYIESQDLEQNINKSSDVLTIELPLLYSDNVSMYANSDYSSRMLVQQSGEPNVLYPLKIISDSSYRNEQIDFDFAKDDIKQMKINNIPYKTVESDWINISGSSIETWDGNAVTLNMLSDGSTVTTSNIQAAKNDTDNTSHNFLTLSDYESLTIDFKTQLPAGNVTGVPLLADLSLIGRNNDIVGSAHVDMPKSGEINVVRFSPTDTTHYTSEVHWNRDNKDNEFDFKVEKINGNNTYILNNIYFPDDTRSAKFHSLSQGTYTFKNIPADHPVTLLHNDVYTNNSIIDIIKHSNTIEYENQEVSGLSDFENGTYTFYSGDITVEVKADFGNLSLYCMRHGYMGANSIFKYNPLQTNHTWKSKRIGQGSLTTQSNNFKVKILRYPWKYRDSNRIEFYFNDTLQKTIRYNEYEENEELWYSYYSENTISYTRPKGYILNMNMDMLLDNELTGNVSEIPTGFSSASMIVSSVSVTKNKIEVPTAFKINFKPLIEDFKAVHSGFNHYLIVSELDSWKGLDGHAIYSSRYDNTFNPVSGFPDFANEETDWKTTLAYDSIENYKFLILAVKGNNDPVRTLEHYKANVSDLLNDGVVFGATKEGQNNFYFDYRLSNNGERNSYITPSNVKDYIPLHIGTTSYWNIPNDLINLIPYVKELTYPNNYINYLDDYQSTEPNVVTDDKDDFSGYWWYTNERFQYLYEDNTTVTITFDTYTAEEIQQDANKKTKYNDNKRITPIYDSILLSDIDTFLTTAESNIENNNPITISETEIGYVNDVLNNRYSAISLSDEHTNTIKILYTFYKHQSDIFPFPTYDVISLNKTLYYTLKAIREYDDSSQVITHLNSANIEMNTYFTNTYNDNADAIEAVKSEIPSFNYTWNLSEIETFLTTAELNLQNINISETVIDYVNDILNNPYFTDRFLDTHIEKMKTLYKFYKHQSNISPLPTNHDVVSLNKTIYYTLKAMKVYIDRNETILNQDLSNLEPHQVQRQIEEADLTQVITHLDSANTEMEAYFTNTYNDNADAIAAAKSAISDITFYEQHIIPDDLSEGSPKIGTIERFRLTNPKDNYGEGQYHDLPRSTLKYNVSNDLVIYGQYSDDGSHALLKLQSLSFKKDYSISSITINRLIENPIMDGAFGGAYVNNDQYEFPLGAQDWAGFYNTNLYIYPITLPDGGKITFDYNTTLTVNIKFVFEYDAYPNVDPSYHTEVFTCDGIGSGEIDIPSQYSNVYRNFLLYLVTKDVTIQITNIRIHVN